jgi:polynucleotide 5'-kinase involved in rRNA processing
LIDENEVKFKPIEWSNEEIFSIPDILKQNNALDEKKKLHVYDSNKEPLIVIFIGHVDSGKSTISGQILC